MIRAGLMGLGQGGRRLADALLASSWCELIAVGSARPERLESFAAQHPGIATYHDLRSLIVEPRLEALFVAVPPYVRGKYLALAVERGLPVWMLTPPARGFDEAVEIAQTFERAGCPIVVSRSWGVEPAMQPDAWGREEMGSFFFARGSVMTCWPEDLDWRGDSVRAGGGVLLDCGYGLMDAVVQAMGTPSTVYARLAGVSRPGGRFPYDTEDTASVICHFSGGAMAVLSACGTSGPEQWCLDLFATGGSIHCDEHRVVTRDRTGHVQITEQARGANFLTPQVEDFLGSLRMSPGRLRSTLREHLTTMAVLQAAYLSARTGQPESPVRLLTMHGIRESTAVSS